MKSFKYFESEHNTACINTCLTVRTLAFIKTWLHLSPALSSQTTRALFLDTENHD